MVRVRLYVDNRVIHSGKFISKIMCECGAQHLVDVGAYRQQMLFTDIELPKCECGLSILSFRY